MRCLKENNKFFDYYEIAELVELCEDNLDGFKNADLRKVLRNTNGIKGFDPATQNSAMVADRNAIIRKQTNKINTILSKNKSLFNKDIQKQECKNILENIKILIKQVNQLKNVYSSLLQNNYSTNDQRWAASLYIKAKKSSDSNLKLVNNKEEKQKYDDFKKFFNTINNILISTSEDKSIIISLDNLISYCRRTISRLKANYTSSGIYNDKEAKVVNRYSVAYHNLINIKNLVTDINKIITPFKTYTWPITNSSKYREIFDNSNLILKRILEGLKKIMGDQFE